MSSPTLDLLLQIDRQAILGRLASGLTHVMNNVLGGVIGQVDLLMITNGGANLQKDLEQVIQFSDEGVVFAKAISKVIAAFQEKRPADVNESLKALVILINRIYRRAGIRAEYKNLAGNPLAANGELFVQTLFHLMLIAFEDRYKNRSGEESKPIDLVVKANSEYINISINCVKELSQNCEMPSSSEGVGYHNWIINKTIELGGGTAVLNADSQECLITWPVWDASVL